METLKLIQNKIDGLQLRERGIMLAAILIAIYFLFDTFVMQPLAINQKNVNTNIVRINSDIVTLSVKIQQAITESPASRRQKELQEIQQLRQEKDDLDRELQNATANLVTPQQMTELLQKILGQTDGLHLIKVTSLGSSPLVEQAKAGVSPGKKTEKDDKDKQAKDENIVNTVYKHGLQIQFEGNFFATLDYLRKLEQLQWKFIWDDIKFEVKEYPQATTTLSLYTISLNKNWIGV